ncbi:MAG: pilus motility taxis protein HmpF [Leptolyngbyaceae bacterium]|nr:pilus motility taxis protein HmpF [Leptolyngbyaceae bacterium]
MLYLAEVQKETTFVKGTKTKLKLLACQRTEQSWSAVPGEEAIQTDEANKFNEGVLVLVDLTASKQVQRIQEASRQLVSTLQNFSRLQEKFKTQEEEIEQWKQSLTYQSQELNRREMEMESRQAQLEQLAEDCERLDQQRHEFEGTRAEVDRLREELNRSRQELEGAWEHLRGEQQRLQERQSEVQRSAVLDEEQARHIQELLNRLSGAVTPTESVREQLNLGFEILDRQQAVLNQHWQRLEQQRSSAQQLQGEVDQQVQTVQSGWQNWQQAQNGLEQLQIDLRVNQGALKLKQEQEQMLRLYLQHQEELYQQIDRLKDASAGRVGAKIDTIALENMPFEELRTIVQDLQQDLEKLSRFVNDQEEELVSQQETIDELQAKIQQASEYDRLSLETEMADEQESYKMLVATLEGQRRNLQERREVLSIHQNILLRRSGQGEAEKIEGEIDLEPVLGQIATSKQQQAQELAQLEAQIAELQGLIEQTQGRVEGQARDQENRHNELRRLEQELSERQRALGELWGQTNTYQETLQPTQDHMNELRNKLDAIAGILGQVQEAGDYQLQTIAEMRQVFANLINAPAFT